MHVRTHGRVACAACQSCRRDWHGPHTGPPLATRVVHRPRSDRPRRVSGQSVQCIQLPESQPIVMFDQIWPRVHMLLTCHFNTLWTHVLHAVCLLWSGVERMVCSRLLTFYTWQACCSRFDNVPRPLHNPLPPSPNILCWHVIITCTIWRRHRS